MMKRNHCFILIAVESSDLGLFNWNCHCTWYFVFLCYLKPIIITQNQFKNKKKEWQVNTDLKAKKLLKAVFCGWRLLHLMRKIKFLAFYFCCFCSLGTEHASLSNETKEFASLSNERNETNLLAPLTLLLFYFFCFNLLSFFFSPLDLLVKIMSLIPRFFFRTLTLKLPRSHY